MRCSFRLLVINLIMGAMMLSPLVLHGQAAPAADPAPSQTQDNTVVVDINQAPANEPHIAWRGITVNGFLSFSYSYNINQPIIKINQYRVFDYADNQPQLDMGQIVIQHSIEKPNQVGFRFNFIAGQAVPQITSAYGLFRNPKTLQGEPVDIPEMYASYIAPIGKGLRIDGGKFATHMGSEIIGGYDGYNDEFSRGFIFGFGVPFTHTGVKATYAFNSKISAMFLVTNGWDEFQRFNHGISFGGQVVLTATKNTALYFNWIHGPEIPHDDIDNRNAVEIVGSWKTTPKLNLGFDALYGHEQNGVRAGYDAIWKGLAGYVKYAFSPKFSLAFRGEVFNDSGGTRTGTVQTLQGYTLTPEYDFPATLSKMSKELRRLDGKFAIRGEVRLDHSTQDIFLRNDTWVPNQFTSAINFIYLF